MQSSYGASTAICAEAAASTSLIPCEQSAKDNIHIYVPPAVGGQLEAELLPPGNTDFADVKPGFTVPSLRFVQALFDIYLRSGAPYWPLLCDWMCSGVVLLRTNEHSASSCAAHARPT